MNSIKPVVASAIVSLTVFTLAGSMACGPDGELKQTEDQVREELVRLQRRWMEAATRQDTETLDRILADDFFATDLTGAIMTRSEYIAGDEGLAVESFDYDDVRVRLLEGTAVVSHLLRFRGTFKGQDISGDYRETVVWARKSDGWQAVTLHVTMAQNK